MIALCFRLLRRLLTRHFPNIVLFGKSKTPKGSSGIDVAAPPPSTSNAEGAPAGSR
jgi:hypothetical protein